MSETATFAERYGRWLHEQALDGKAVCDGRKRLMIVHIASQEIEAIHAMYRPRIERLESEIERLTQDLVSVLALVDSRGG